MGSRSQNYNINWIKNSWKTLKSLKISKKKATNRGCRGGKSRRKQGANSISLHIPTLVTNRPTVLSRTLLKSTVNSSNLNVDLVKHQASSPIKFCNFNARSVCNKTLAIADFILNNDIDICTITETWLSSSPNSPAVINELIPTGYKFLHCPRTNKRGGGVAIIIRECFKIKKTSFADSSFANFECLNCIVSVNEKHLFIAIVYRPPHSKSNGLSKSAFFEEWKIV